MHGETMKLPKNSSLTETVLRVQWRCLERYFIGR